MNAHFWLFLCLDVGVILVIETQKELLLRSLFWFVGLVEPLLLYYDRYNIQNKLTNILRLTTIHFVGINQF